MEGPSGIMAVVYAKKESTQGSDFVPTDRELSWPESDGLPEPERSVLQNANIPAAGDLRPSGHLAETAKIQNSLGRW